MGDLRRTPVMAVRNLDCQKIPGVKWLGARAGIRLRRARRSCGYGGNHRRIRRIFSYRRHQRSVRPLGVAGSDSEVPHSAGGRKKELPG